MKHIFTLAAVVLAFQVSAQQVEQLPRKATEQELEVSRLLGLEEIARAESKGLRGGGDSTIVFFYEDFANGFAGNNGYGALTVEDSSPDVTIWQYVDASGDGFYQDATESGVQPPAGEFSTNIGGLNSETADNGWMIFDCDYYNTPISSGVEDTEGFLNLPTLDMTELESVVISWDQYLRYCCYPYLPIYVEVSTDGGASWTSFEAGGTFIPSANSASANPLVTGLDISCAAAGEAAVDIRFAYRQNPIVGNGYSHYYWGIDDIRIEANPVADDLELVQLTNGDVYFIFEYRVTPMEQAIPAADGGVLAGVLYRNTGYADQDSCGDGRGARRHGQRAQHHGDRPLHCAFLRQQRQLPLGESAGHLVHRDGLGAGHRGSVHSPRFHEQRQHRRCRHARDGHGVHRVRIRPRQPDHARR